jgi:putative transposase
MPRTPRIQYDDAFYHVINRGRGRSNIFHSKVYYQLFLDIISDVALVENLEDDVI